MRPQEVVELLDLVFFGNVGKLFQEALEVTARREVERVGKIGKAVVVMTASYSIYSILWKNTKVILFMNMGMCIFVSLLEAVGREEVEQVEQLLQVVLQRSSCQQQLVVDLIIVQTPEKLQTRTRKSQTLSRHTYVT